MTLHGTPAVLWAQTNSVSSRRVPGWVWPISCQSVASRANIHSHPHLPLARRGPAASGETPSQMKSRRAEGWGGVTAVQTLCTVVAPNLSGYGCRIYYGVIRTKTALHTVPGGRRVTTGHQAPCGPAPGLRPHRFWSSVNFRFSSLLFFLSGRTDTALKCLKDRNDGCTS